MRRVVVSDKHKGNSVTKGTISHGGGAIGSGSEEGTGGFQLCWKPVWMRSSPRICQGDCSETKQKLLFFFLFVCTLENYLHNFL